MEAESVCGDDRFEIIEKAKQHLIESTNISSSQEEMNVIDTFLFRCWQMGWLDHYGKNRKFRFEFSNNLIGEETIFNCEIVAYTHDEALKKFYTDHSCVKIHHVYEIENI